MVGQAVPKPNPYLTPQGLEARKQALIQSMNGVTPLFNRRINVPGNQDMTPPIQSIWTGLYSGAAQGGSPAAQMSSSNPNIQALANVRGGY